MSWIVVANEISVEDGMNKATEEIDAILAE